MSYRNPQYKVFSQSQNYQKMFDSIGNAAKSITDAKIKLADQDKARKEADKKQRVLTQSTWQESSKDASKQPVFNETLKGMDEIFGDYNKMILDGDCGENDPNCSKAITNKARMLELPDQLIQQGATWQEQVDFILGNPNVDTNHPMYNKLMTISKILKKTKGYDGNGNNYGVEVSANFDKESGEYTGNTTWRFNGEEFGEEGYYELNSADLERMTKGDGNLVADSPDFWEQSNRINQSTSLFKGPPGMNPKDMWNENGTPAAGVTLDPKFQLRNPYSATETVGPNGELGTAQTPDSSIRYGKQSYTAKDGTTKYRQFQYNVIAWDEDLLKDEARNSARVEADAMLNPADPQDAIAFWNKNLAAKYTDDMKEQYRGPMSYEVALPGAPGNLVYDGKGNISEDFKKNFYDAYEQYYYDNTIKGFVEQGVENTDVVRKWTDKCFKADGTPTECDKEDNISKKNNSGKQNWNVGDN